jgi:hypothetical protein
LLADEEKDKGNNDEKEVENQLVLYVDLKTHLVTNVASDCVDIREQGIH